MVRPADGLLRRMADIQSEAKIEILEKMMVGFHDQLARVQDEVAALTRAVDDIAKIKGEVANLSNSVKGLTELKSLIEHMVQRQGSTMDDPLISDHQQGSSRDPLGFQQEITQISDLVLEKQLLAAGKTPSGKAISDLVLEESDDSSLDLLNSIAIIKEKDKEALPMVGKARENILRCGAEESHNMLGEQDAEWALTSGFSIGDMKWVEVNLRKCRELWRCIWASDLRQIWAQRNPISPSIKCVKRLSSISFRQTTENGFVGRCLGHNGEQTMWRPTNLLWFDGRESIGWILGAGRMDTTTTFLPTPQDLQIPLTEIMTIDEGSGGDHSHSHYHHDGQAGHHVHPGHSHSLQDLFIGLSILTGIVVFFIIEKLVKYVDDFSGGVLNQSLEAKLVNLQAKVDQLNENKRQLEKERALNHEEVGKELSNVKLEVESNRRASESRERQVELMVAEAEALASKISSVKEEILSHIIRTVALITRLVGQQASMPDMTNVALQDFSSSLIIQQWKHMTLASLYFGNELFTLGFELTVSDVGWSGAEFYKDQASRPALRTRLILRMVVLLGS